MDGLVKGILIPERLIQDVDQYPLTVSLNGSDRNVLGNFNKTDTGMLFEPVIPLSTGMEYGILQANRVVGKITVPAATGKPPVVTAIYPQADTVPENLLKFYIEFSEPMQTGNALDYIFLLDKNRDTLQRIFLDLKPELWDPTEKVLTVWIDPGRIKRELVLNKELGNPLHSRHAYQLVISGKWRDGRGLNMGKDISKKFVVNQRVDEQLSIDKWRVAAPKAGSKQPVIVYSDHPLDHYLLKESVTVLGKDGKPIEGEITLADRDKTWMFTPGTQWLLGTYKLRVAARLEDLAGNNLNKVFDRDIYKQKKNDNSYYERAFEVR
ncbi:hypothetical protein ACFQZS_05660 [Mucilaginibacter calamicampi]|uniref:SbsA Ig-like domain-containing protein n=2 Tax=Mucilaginibacter calamicampi TaxID=1302352 RepID=A0ABW2YUT1_9SPHI